MEEQINGKGGKGTGEPFEGEKDNLNDKAKAEFYEMAKKEDIVGRSKMKKGEFIKNLQKN